MSTDIIVLLCKNDLIYGGGIQNSNSTLNQPNQLMADATRFNLDSGAGHIFRIKLEENKIMRPVLNLINTNSQFVSTCMQSPIRTLTSDKLNLLMLGTTFKDSSKDQSKGEVSICLWL